MHIIRSRRFSSVRFWHLLLLLALFSWMSVGTVLANSEPCTSPEITNVSMRPIFPMPLTQIIVVPSVELSNDHNKVEQCVAEDIAASAEVNSIVVEPTLVPTPKLRAEPTPTPVPTVKPTPAPITAPADLESLFTQHATTHGVDPMIMKKIAQCESGMRPEATNGPYGGMFQFVSSTWVSNRKAMGKDPNPALRFNASEAIETAAFKMGRDGYGAWPACSRKALASI